MDRRRRAEWLLETYRADKDARVFVATPAPHVCSSRFCSHWETRPACRCYRCGTLLTIETLTVDRIIPGAQGGTYRRNNIRPACQPCQTITGNELKAALKAA